ncbi:MAG: hypothetical protein ACPHUF_04115 [Gammaproteobacteria bacterium]
MQSVAGFAAFAVCLVIIFTGVTDGLEVQQRRFVMLAAHIVGFVAAVRMILGLIAHPNNGD